MRTNKVLAIITIMLLGLTLLQGFTHVIHVRELSGVSNSCDKPYLSFHGFMDGTFQQQADKYAKNNIGFREILIRLYNQHIWSLYGKSTNYCVMKGDDGYLYERYFVEDYYESRMYEFADDSSSLRERFEHTAQQLSLLQDSLASHGKKIFVAILPSKNILYPDHIPAPDWNTRPFGISAYDTYLQLFDRYGINYVDMCQWLKEQRDTLPFDVMTKYGTHWSNAACVYSFDSIVRYMQSSDATPFVKLSISKPYIDKKRHPDDDLYQLLNLIFPSRGEKYKYMDVSVAECKKKPKLLVIGDSFFWNVRYNFPLKDIFSSAHYWFYNNSVYFDENHHNVSEVNLSEELATTDYIMLSYCTGQLYELGNGFIEKALATLTGE